MEKMGHGIDKFLPYSSWFLLYPQPQPRALRTHVSWGSTGCGEHTVWVFHLGEAKVGDHDLGVFIQAIVQQILWLEGQTIGEGAVRWPEAGRTFPSTP